MTPFYDDGKGIQIFCGDCRDVLPTLPPCDLLLTDPPYGIGLANHAAGKERADMDWTIHGDLSQSLGVEVLSSVEGPTIAFASPRMPWPGEWRQHLVWSKGEHVGGGGDPGKCWKQDWELIQVRQTPDLKGNRDSSVLWFPAVKDDYRFHPSPKPIGLMKYLISKTNPQTIIDPFMGSGSTLLAAKLLGRRCIGIEIEKRYCEIAVQRLRQGVLEFT